MFKNKFSQIITFFLFLIITIILFKKFNKYYSQNDFAKILILFILLINFFLGFLIRKFTKITLIFFGYFILTPISINFLANYQLDPSILNEFDIISYVGTITTLVLASGLLFQLPMIIIFLTKAGIVNKEILRSYRKHAIVVILVFGAMLTPPDPFSQIVMAIPLVGLYEISILISSKVKK